MRTARAKGLSEGRVLFRHVLHNALIPILTGVVVAIPSLFIGSLVTESFFGIPGTGQLHHRRHPARRISLVVRAMVFLGSVLYIVGLILTDVSYTLADPRDPTAVMPFKPVILWTDALVFLLVAVVIAFGWYIRRHEHLMAPWRKVARSRYGMCALVVLMPFVAIGLLDSLHYRPRLEASQGDGQVRLCGRSAERARRSWSIRCGSARRADLLGPAGGLRLRQGNGRAARRHRRRASFRGSSSAARISRIRPPSSCPTYCAARSRASAWRRLPGSC